MRAARGRVWFWRLFLLGLYALLSMAIRWWGVEPARELLGRLGAMKDSVTATVAAWLLTALAPVLPYLLALVATLYTAVSLPVLRVVFGPELMRMKPRLKTALFDLELPGVASTEAPARPQHAVRVLRDGLEALKYLGAQAAVEDLRALPALAAQLYRTFDRIVNLLLGASVAVIVCRAGHTEIVYATPGAWSTSEREALALAAASAPKQDDLEFVNGYAVLHFELAPDGWVALVCGGFRGKPDHEGYELEADVLLILAMALENGIGVIFARQRPEPKSWQDAGSGV